MKRFFAGLLALLLLIPAVCFSGFSEEADATTATGGGRLPARYGTITADGTAEAAMAYDTPILKTTPVLLHLVQHGMKPHLLSVSSVSRLC